MQGDFELAALYEALDAQRQARGLTWSAVAREVGGVSVSTITGLRDRESAEGDGVLQMLRWLGRTPESFVDGQTLTDDEAALPAASASKVMRLDVRAIYEALEGERTRRGITWQEAAKQMGIPHAASLTRLRHGSRIGFPLVMRLLAWLHLPAARFVRLADR